MLEGWKQGLRNCWWVIDYNRQSLDAVVREGLWERYEPINFSGADTASASGLKSFHLAASAMGSYSIQRDRLSIFAPESS